MCMYVYMYVYVCMYMYMYVYVYVCMYVYSSTFIPNLPLNGGTSNKQKLPKTK